MLVSKLRMLQLTVSVSHLQDIPWPAPLRCSIEGKWQMIEAFLLLLQSATTQQIALATETPVEKAEPSEPATKPKRVCRTVIDTLTGLIAKSHKVCRDVAADREQDQ